MVSITGDYPTGPMLVQKPSSGADEAISLGIRTVVIYKKNSSYVLITNESTVVSQMSCDTKISVYFGRCYQDVIS